MLTEMEELYQRVATLESYVGMLMKHANGVSKKSDSAASKVLRNKVNSKSAKTAAGSALSQPRRKGK